MQRNIKRNLNPSKSRRKCLNQKVKLMRVHGVQERPLNDDRNEQHNRFKAEIKKNNMAVIPMIKVDYSQMA